MRKFSSAIDIGDADLLGLDPSDLDGDGLTNEEMPFDLDRNTRRLDDPGITDLLFDQYPAPDAGCYEFAGISCMADIAGPSVQPPPDGNVDGSDFIAFINAFAASDLAADITGADLPIPDGVIDGSDFIAFINAFAAGC